ncbi:MAG: flagellar biosynthetic protein FliO [Planctomycetota bacterium]
MDRRWVWILIGWALGASGLAFAQPAIESRPIGPQDAGSELTTAAPVGDRGGWIRSAGALALVIALILCVGWVARKMSGGAGLPGQLGAGGRAPSGVLEVLGRFPIARGQTLVLLRLDTRVLLLSQHAGAGFQTLCEVTEPEQVASLLVKTRSDEEAGKAERFRGMLGRFQREHPSESPASVSSAAHEPVHGPMSRTVRATPEGDRVELLRGSPAVASLVERVKKGVVA